METGRLTFPVGPADLLKQPREILATLIAFADGEPLDICLYAYAGGNARELRLTCAMNAIVDAMPRSLIASVSLLISPTTPTPLTPGDVEAVSTQLSNRPAWERCLDTCGLFGAGRGYTQNTNYPTSRTVVSIQGMSYQAAQYLGKIIKATCWANSAMRVSANTAAITRTRSLDHPVFAAAFGGAAALRVETFTPRMSKQISGLLTVHDWLHPNLPTPGHVRVHGGIHTMAYPLNTALRVAAAIGFVRSPGLLRGLAKTAPSSQTK